ncbi:MAG: CCA tRNA nucleotidyltransferase [archaeon GBS-70-058]|nr:CCA tRNA nucleotidyltransferase [Candidatus Culexarchaeum nevadense]
MDLNEVLSKALEVLKPSADERIKLESLLNRLIDDLKRGIRELRLDLNVEVEGSIAKDTWLSKEQDIDVFLLFPKNYDKNEFRNVLLNLARKVVGDNFVEAYAEHPYVELNYEGVKIDLVPCLKLNSVDEAKTAVDRTPFHTAYVRANLSENAKDEVRLLKGFMKGIGCYGAEMKVKGFSGYLCELLVLYYGSFISVLKNAINWKPFSTVIDIEGYYGNPKEAIRIFNAPLIVIDPVDKNRNVAAALSIDSMSKFISASKMFIESPNLRFFFPEPIEPLSKDKMVSEFSSRGSDLIFIITNCPKVHSEILWGQLYKTLNGLRNLLLNFDFNVINCDVWSDEKDTVVFIFELEHSNLPSIKRHVGPPVYIFDEANRFLNKYLNSPNVFSGPRIEGFRWVVYLKRKYSDVKQLLFEKMKNAKMGNLMKSLLMTNQKILKNEEILDFYSSNKEFATFLTKYLKGTYPWLTKSKF